LKGVAYTAYLCGRLSLDVWKEVDLDTSLTGLVKNKQLKTVAKYFFGNEFVREVDRSAIDSLSSDELYWYCFSDSRLTWLLADMYLMVLKYLAVLHNVPLDFIVNRSPSHIGNLIFGRRLKALDVVSDGSNFERYAGVLWGR
jgi:DNA polymerase elongation subunit (family B)